MSESERETEFKEFVRKDRLLKGDLRDHLTYSDAGDDHAHMALV